MSLTVGNGETTGWGIGPVVGLAMAGREGTGNVCASGSGGFPPMLAPVPWGLADTVVGREGEMFGRGAEVPEMDAGFPGMG